jgi:hypothetical protein
VERQKRVLPDGKILFEPTYEELDTRYHPNFITPVEIIFNTPGQKTLYHWRLEPLNEPYRYDLHRHRTYIHKPECYTLNRFLIFHKFRIADSKGPIPVKVYYKQDVPQNPNTKLHAVSIPLESLLELIIAKRGLA